MQKALPLIVAASLLPLSACSSIAAAPVNSAASAPAQKEATLANAANKISGKWTVKEIASAEIAETSAPTFQIAEGAIRGNSGCNPFQASFEIKEGFEIKEDGQIQIGQAATGRMLCPPDRMQVERRFLESLSSSSRYTIGASGDLVLYNGASVTIRAQRDN